MNGQGSVFPRKLTAISLFILLLVMGFGMYSMIKSVQLLNSFQTQDIPALQLSCATTRVLNETALLLKTPKSDRNQINFQIQILDDSISELSLITNGLEGSPDLLKQSKNYEQFRTMVSDQEVNSPKDQILASLKEDVQNSIELYLQKKNKLVKKNILFGYISAGIILVGLIFFFILLYAIYLRYQKNLEKVNLLTANIESDKLVMMQTSKMASLGEMAAGLAHEINNPLAVIIGRTEIMLSQINEGQATETDIMKTFSKIGEMAFRISSIVSSMRKVSKSSGNNEATILNLSTVISDVLNLSQERIRNLTIDFDSSGVDTTLLVNANFTHICQVVINLLNNAVDELEKLADSDRKIILTTEEQNEFVLLKITDSGPGIPANLRDKIFEPFFSTKDVGKGTGLGLSISKGLMKDMGGDLVLSLDTDKTCFILKLQRN